MSEVCKKPLGYITLPSHPEVIVQCAYWGRGAGTTVNYEGTLEALIKSGIATAEMLSGTYPGRKRVDSAGHHFRLQRSFRTEGGSPRPYCKVAFWMPIDLIDRMPGARQAIYAHSRLRLWYDDGCAEHIADSQSAARATADILARFARG